MKAFVDIKLRTRVHFANDKRRRLAPFASSVASKLGATEAKTFNRSGKIMDSEIIENYKKKKISRGLLLSHSRVAKLEQQVLQKALQWSSGNITYDYLRKYRPYSSRNPRISSSYWHIINDHSNDSTVPTSYSGKRFKKSWLIKYSILSTGKRENAKGVLLIQNNAPYSMFIRATEVVQGRQVKRPIFSKLLEYARKRI